MADLDAPTTTLFFLTLLALEYAALALVVVALRVRTNSPFGDGGHALLNRAIRAHGNFAEWVPLAILLVGGLELLGERLVIVQSLLAVLFVARVAHPIGLFAPLGSITYMVGRISGALLTWMVVLASAVLLLIRLV